MFEKLSVAIIKTSLNDTCHTSAFSLYVGYNLGVHILYHLTRKNGHHTIISNASPVATFSGTCQRLCPLVEVLLYNNSSEPHTLRNESQRSRMIPHLYKFGFVAQTS